MKRIAAITALILAATVAFAQGVRVDIPLWTSGPSVPVSGGPLPQSLLLANSTVNICVHPATASSCTPITTYTDVTLATACPTNSPIVQLPGTACVSTTGPRGNLGFWYSGGVVDYFVHSSYGSFGPFTTSGGTTGPTGPAGATGAQGPPGTPGTNANISGQANGVIPLATTATSLTTQSHLDDGVTLSGTLTSTENLNLPSTVTSAQPLFDIRSPVYGGFSTICAGGTTNDIGAVVQAILNAMPITGGEILIPGSPSQCWWANPNAIVWPSFTGNVTIYVQGLLQIGTTFVRPAGTHVNLIGRSAAPLGAFMGPGQIAEIYNQPAVGSCQGTLGTAIVSTGVPTTFTPSSMVCMYPGAEIAVAGTTSCTISSITHQTTTAPYSFPVDIATLSGACHIPDGVGVTVASVTNTAFNGAFNGTGTPRQFWTVHYDWPLFTLVWNRNDPATTISGTVSGGSTSITIASGTNFANGDTVTIAGAGTAGGLYTGTISSGGGTTTLVVTPATTTTVNNGAVVKDTASTSSGGTVTGFNEDTAEFNIVTSSSATTANGGITSGATSITVASGAGFACTNTDTITIAGAGTSGGLYTGTVSSGCGTNTLVISPATATKVGSGAIILDTTVGNSATAQFYNTHASGDSFYGVLLGGQQSTPQHPTSTSTGESLTKDLNLHGPVWLPQNFGDTLENVSAAVSIGQNIAWFTGFQIDYSSFIRMKNVSTSGEGPYSIRMSQPFSQAGAGSGPVYLYDSFIVNGIMVKNGATGLYAKNVAIDQPNGAGVTYNPSTYFGGVQAVFDLDDMGVNDFGNNQQVCLFSQAFPSPNAISQAIITTKQSSSGSACNLNEYATTNKHTTIGPYLASGFSDPATSTGQRGVTGTVAIGAQQESEIRGEQAGIAPALIPYASLPVITNPSSWPSSQCTVATGVLGPDGQSTAGTLTGTIGAGSSQVESFSVTPAVGDMILYGVWAQTPTQNKTATFSNTAVLLDNAGSTHFFFDTLYGGNGSGTQSSQLLYDMFLPNDWWHPVIGVARIGTADGTAGSIRASLECNIDRTIAYWQPFMIYIPATANVPLKEVLRWRQQMLHGYVPAGGFSGFLYANYPLDLQGNSATTELPNNTASGATLNKIAVEASVSGAAKAQTATTASTIWSGIVVGGATGSTAGNTLLARFGQAACVFDGSTTIGDFAQISSTVAGDCHDTGSSTYPTSGAVIGKVLTANGGTGTTANVHLYSPGITATPVATATSSSLGVVQPDNSTITINGSGIISASPGAVPHWLSETGTGADGSNTNASGACGGEKNYTTYTIPNGNTVIVGAPSCVIRVTGTCTIAGKVTLVDTGNETGGCGPGGGGSGGGTAGGTAGETGKINWFGTGANTISGGTAGAASGGNGGAGGVFGANIAAARSCVQSGGGIDSYGFSGGTGQAGGSSGGAAGHGASGLTLICGTLTGTDGTHIGIIDATGGSGAAAGANTQGSGSGGGAGPVYLSSLNAVTTWPTVFTEGGAGAVSNGVAQPTAMWTNDTCTTIPKVSLTVTTGALSACAVQTAGASCSSLGQFTQTGTGGGTGGTITPTWQSATPTGSGGGSGSVTFTVSSGTGITIGMNATGTNIQAQSYVVAISGTTVTLNNPLTGTASGTVTFTGGALQSCTASGGSGYNANVTYTTSGNGGDGGSGYWFEFAAGLLVNSWVH